MSDLQTIPAEYSSGPPLPTCGVLFGERAHAPGYHIRLRRESYDKVLFVHAGQVRMELVEAGTVVTLEPGTFVYLPNGVTHDLLDLTPATVFYLCFTLEAFASRGAQSIRPQLRQRLGEGMRPIPVVLQDVQLLWREALHRQRQAAAQREFALQLLAQRILLLLLESEQAEALAPAEERMRHLIDRIAETYFADWDVMRAARMAQLSRRQFSRVFRSVSGSSFVEHLNELRLAHAAKLMREGRTTIAGSAFCCGFQDLSHFYRLFRKKYGMPPRRYIMQP